MNFSHDYYRETNKSVNHKARENNTNALPLARIACGDGRGMWGQPAPAVRRAQLDLS